MEKHPLVSKTIQAICVLFVLGFLGFLLAVNLPRDSSRPLDPVDPTPSDPPQTLLLPHCQEEAQYGHQPYPEYTGELVSVAPNQLLHPEAAHAVEEMRQAALADGVELRVISAFRSRETQDYLFHEIARQRGQTLEERAEVSAPPGYSEHATGLTVDFNSLEERFATTPAFAWLENNAGEYGFEMSFPEDNAQGIDFEPWHWKFVDSLYARQIFCREGVLVPDPEIPNRFNPARGEG